MSKILDKLKTFDGYLSLEEVNSDIDLVKEEFLKLQYQLKIQTKRVENLKKSNEFYANKSNWFYDFGIFKSITEEDSEHTEHPDKGIHRYYGGKLARSCQVIDQELEKQSEEI